MSDNKPKTPRQLLAEHYAAQDKLATDKATQKAAEAAGPLPAGRQWRLTDHGMFKRPEPKTDK